MITEDDDNIINLQEEVRNLHQQLKHKNSLIDKLKTAISEGAASSNEEGVAGSNTELQNKLKSMINKEERFDKSSKEYE